MIVARVVLAGVVLQGVVALLAAVAECVERVLRALVERLASAGTSVRNRP